MNETKHSEWLTRKRLIDPQRKAVGWKVTPHSADLDLRNSEPLAIEEFPTDYGPADYALCADGLNHHESSPGSALNMFHIFC